MQGQGLMQSCRRTFHLHRGMGQKLIDLFVYLLTFGPFKGKGGKLFHNQEQNKKENPSLLSLCSSCMSWWRSQGRDSGTAPALG